MFFYILYEITGISLLLFVYTHTQYKNILQMVLHNNQKDEMPQQQQQNTAGHTARE